MKALYISLVILLCVSDLRGQATRRIGDDQPLRNSLNKLPMTERESIYRALQPEIERWLRRFKEEDKEKVKQEAISVQRDLRYELRGDLVMVQAHNLDGCGAVGNCQFFLLDGEHHVLLSDVVAYYLTVLPSLHLGRPDILLGEHVSASETAQTWYRFNGLRYDAVRCATDNYGLPYLDGKRNREFGPCAASQKNPYNQEDHDN
jgi:hypothetical protein